MRDFHEITLDGMPFVDIIKQYKTLALVGRRKPLVEADLSNTNLRGVDLSNLTFADANFTNSDLWLADLSLVRFIASNFGRARLEEANLSGAIFQICDFNNANLRGANLVNATFDEVNLCGADLRHVKLFVTVAENITYDDDTLWPKGLEEYGIEINKMATWKKVKSRFDGS